MGMMLKSVVESFAKNIDMGTDKNRIKESARNWADNNFNVGSIRPLASQTLIKIATETNLMNSSGSNGPTSLSDYIAKEVEQLGQYKDSF